VRDVVGTSSAAMQEVFSKVRHVALTDTTVLLTGETGTGKSLIARILHNHSSRKDRQFISVHCGAIPDTLTESELFGHEKGAFTGAVRRKPGKFELAHGGTIFLDEIGTISPCVQIKLLDVVQERVFQRVGGDGDIRTDVRIIAATNEDLRQLSARGLFRKDLYYRLNVFPIHVPPLRERQEDILRLTELFIKRCNIRLMKKIRGVHPQVARGFMRYDWPGNVRELENLIERACILEDGDILGPHRFPEECFHASSPAGSGGVDTSLPIATARRLVVDGFERAYLDRLLQECCGSVTRAAERAGITTRQLRKLMVRHHVDRKKYAHRAEALSVQRTGKENP
jgi:transcriptional regulator with GAF, ATPase, and Fis domain